MTSDEAPFSEIDRQAILSTASDYHPGPLFDRVSAAQAGFPARRLG